MCQDSKGTAFPAFKTSQKGRLGLFKLGHKRQKGLEKLQERQVAIA
jgi:hypothetical protein